MKKLLFCTVLITLLVISFAGCSEIMPTQTKHILTLVVEPVEGGFIGNSPGEYNDQALLGVQANPYSGWAFSYWDGDIANSAGASYPKNNPIDIVMDRDRWIKAVFVTATPTPAPTPIP